MGVDILENLKHSVIACDSKGATTLARKAMDEKIDPIMVLNALTEGIREVGDGFGRGELWLPDLIGAAEALQAATPIIEEQLRRTTGERKPLATVVIGTVQGDVHSIGKNMVSTLLTAEGFKVIDLGIDVSADRFGQAVKEQQPDILAMSALLTMTALEQKKVVDTLKEGGIREKVKIMVGGGAVTEKFAQTIGADGYDATAVGAVGLAKRLIGMA